VIFSGWRSSGIVAVTLGPGAVPGTLLCAVAAVAIPVTLTTAETTQANANAALARGELILLTGICPGSPGFP
jgi:hypothetical protein